MSGEKRTWSYYVGIHTGGWHWAADQYRQLTAGWLKDFDAPKWLRESNGLEMHSTQFGGSDEFRSYPKRYMDTRYAGLDSLWAWGPQSSPRGPCGDGFYFPSPHFGSEQELAEANAAVHALGGRIGFYQWANWNVNYETSSSVAYGSVEKSVLPEDLLIPRSGYAEKNQLMHRDGTTYFFPIYMPKSGVGGIRYNHNPPKNPENYAEYRPTLMYPTEEHNEYLKYYSQRWAEKYHADGFYMDEGIMKARPCFNPLLGHVGDGGTGWRMIDSFRQMWEAGKKYNPDFFLNSEGVNCAAGQYVAHFVGVFEPDLDIVKYTFPHQIFLDGNLAGHRAKASFKAVADVFLMGNHLMMSRGGNWRADEDALAAVNLRRNLRKFFAYATYRDKVGISVEDSSIDCRIFTLDFQGNSGIMLTIANSGKLAGKTVQIDEKYPVKDGSKGFAIALDGSVTPVQAVSRDGKITVPIPSSKLSGVIIMDQVAPQWRLLPVITRQKDTVKKPFAWFADVSLTEKTVSADGTELQTNGKLDDLENGRPRGWRIHGDTAVPDSKALRLSVAPGGFVTAASPAVKVVVGKQYRIKWRCRTADFEGARAYVFLEAGKRQQSLTDVSMRGNGDWTEFETGYRPVEGETELRVVLATHDEGVSLNDKTVTYAINILNFGSKSEQGEITVVPEGGEKFTGKFMVQPYGDVSLAATVSSPKLQSGFLRSDLKINAIDYKAEEIDFFRVSK